MLKLWSEEGYEAEYLQVSGHLLHKIPHHKGKNGNFLMHKHGRYQLHPEIKANSTSNRTLGHYEPAEMTEHYFYDVL